MHCVSAVGIEAVLREHVLSWSVSLLAVFWTPEVTSSHASSRPCSNGAGAVREWEQRHGQPRDARDRVPL